MPPVCANGVQKSSFCLGMLLTSPERSFIGFADLYICSLKIEKRITKPPLIHHSVSYFLFWGRLPDSSETSRLLPSWKECPVFNTGESYFMEVARQKLEGVWILGGFPLILGLSLCIFRVITGAYSFEGWTRKSPKWWKRVYIGLYERPQELLRGAKLLGGETFQIDGAGLKRLSKTKKLLTFWML